MEGHRTVSPEVAIKIRFGCGRGEEGWEEGLGRGDRGVRGMRVRWRDQLSITLRRAEGVQRGLDGVGRGERAERGLAEEELAAKRTASGLREKGLAWKQNYIPARVIRP